MEVLAVIPASTLNTCFGLDTLYYLRSSMRINALVNSNMETERTYLRLLMQNSTPKQWPHRLVLTVAQNGGTRLKEPKTQEPTTVNVSSLLL
jgi:hypothetical protein